MWLNSISRISLGSPMDSPNWGYWFHAWPKEVQHIEDTIAERFGPEVWEEIKQFLNRGSVKEEILNSLIE